MRQTRIKKYFPEIEKILYQFYIINNIITKYKLVITIKSEKFIDLTFKFFYLICFSDKDGSNSLETTKSKITDLYLGH